MQNRFRLSNGIRLDKILSRLDLEIYEILYTGIADDSEKTKFDSNSLSNYLKGVKPSISAKNVVQGYAAETLDSMVMDTVPKTWKSRATRLLKHLQSIPDVSWSDRFELVLKKHVVPKTHLVDLVNNLLRKRATITAPVGWKQFANVLRKFNVPRELIGNKDKLKYINASRHRNVTSLHSSSGAKNQLFWNKYLCTAFDLQLC